MAGVSGGSGSGGPETMVVSGASWSSIVQAQSTAIGSASRCCTSAWTAKVCSPAMAPFASKSCCSVYVVGESQTTNTAPSIEHWKTTPGVCDENSNVGVRSIVWSAGFTSMVVIGAVMTPISQLYSAGVASMLPSAPIERTTKKCSPIARPAYVTPEVQGWKPSSLSSEHWNVEPGSLEEKVRVALVLAVSALGPESIVVSGAVVSGGAWIVQLYVAAVPSWFPSPSVARTANVWLPTARPL